MLPFQWLIITILLYSGAIFWQWRSEQHNPKQHLIILFSLGMSAIILHSVILHWAIDTVAGQNLSLFNLISLVAWLVALLVLLIALIKPIENLTLLVFPVAIAAVILAQFIPGHQIVNTGSHPKQLIHILLSTLAFSVMCIAALQALLLATQEYLLRHTRNNYFIQKLPPLEVMEQLLFQIILIGFILLSIVLLTSIIFFHPIFAPQLRQKSLLAIAAWIVFAILLIGRHYLGWRGRTAINWTIAGALLLMALYYGSQFLLH